MICSNMNAPAAFAAGPGAASPDPAEARRHALLDRHLERLDQLIEAGMDMVQGLAAQAAGGPTVVQGDIALAYSRVSRAVRMAILLQSRLVAEPGADAGGEPDTLVVSWMEPEGSISERTAARKERVEQIVEGVARFERDDDEAAERLGRETAERLERDDIYGDVLTRPVSELVADICRDLNLAPDWPRLARQPWAQREIAGGEAGAPLRGFTSPIAAAMAGGPPADPGAMPGEERVAEGESRKRYATASPLRDSS